MRPAETEAWRRTRAKGPLRYVLLRGVLSYGLPMFLVMTFLLERKDLTPPLVAFSAIVWTIGGTLLGLLRWHLHERRFRKTACDAA